MAPTGAPFVGCLAHPPRAAIELTLRSSGTAALAPRLGAQERVWLAVRVRRAGPRGRRGGPCVPEPPICGPSPPGRTVGGASGSQGCLPGAWPNPLPNPRTLYLRVLPGPAGIPAAAGFSRPCKGFWGASGSSAKLLSHWVSQENTKSPASQIRDKQPPPATIVTHSRGSALAPLGNGLPLGLGCWLPENRSCGATQRSYVEVLPSGGQHPPCTPRQGTFVPIQGAPPRELGLGDRIHAQ